VVVPVEALDFLTNENLIELIVKGNFEEASYAKALAHACYDNKALSKRVLRKAL